MRKKNEDIRRWTPEKKETILSQFDIDYDLISQLPDENSVNFATFLIYLGLGIGRTYKKVAGLTGRTYQAICNLGKLYNWDSRAEQYDADFMKIEFARNDYEVKRFFKHESESIIKSNVLLDKTAQALLDDYENGISKATSVAHGLKSIMDAKNTNARLYMRMKGIPESITAEQSKVEQTSHNVNVNLTNPKDVAEEVDSILNRRNADEEEVIDAEFTKESKDDD